MKHKFKIILGVLFVALLTSACIRITENGQHTGQVTAIEDSGYIWKTTTVYFKTNVISSQEDLYCLDKTQSNYNELRDKLQKASENQTRITLVYHSEFFTWFSRCHNEPAIIDKIKYD